MDFKEYTTLGRTGLKVSRLGLSGGYGVPAIAIEKAYREHNINYFYWGSRRTAEMKKALLNLIPSERDKMVITLQSYDHLGPFTKRSVERGLRSLKIDYADILILGWHNWNPGNRILDKVRQLKEQGKIKHVAMSGHNRKFFGKMVQDSDFPIDIFMIRYNAEHPGAEQDIFPYLPEKDSPGIQTYTATSWGRLLKLKKTPPDETPMTAPECYRFALSNSNVNICMMGPKTEKEMDESLVVLNQGPLSEEEMKRIRKIGDYMHK